MVTLTTADDFTHYYQVSYSTKNEQTLARELRPLRAINDFNARTLITMDLEPVTQIDGIVKVNVIDWLLATDSET
jgi:predicted AAA+ superfamily ATPase